ncbi:MAG: 50S ribosomal protein L4 [Actinomycetia bacterium]|nr:50S ribosomal protein L4 [Actinomycetes bacterium]MCP4963224.1 50S ribosomal protein L4 [Actinomycetes bacterium]
MSITLNVKTQSGSDAGTVVVSDELFGIEPNVPVLHQVVTAQLAARRRGTHSTLTRSEVRGGGAKPFRQKGTGRARQGTSRAPQMTGGGVVHGPRPRSYRQKVNKKVVKLALASALSDRVQSDRLVVVDKWSFETPKTREAVAAMQALDLTGRVVLVVDSQDEAATRSFRNIPGVHLLKQSELNAYDILCSDWLVFTTSTLPGADETEGES